MIFCFSGTGNSLHVAKEIAKVTKEEIVMMTQSEMQLHKEYFIQEDENIGFVFPIYWWGIPKEVEAFVKQLRLSYNKLTYSYAVSTYGMIGRNGLYDLQKYLYQMGIYLDATFEVKMVDNYIVGYELIDEKKQNKILHMAETKIKDIVNSISQKEKKKINDYINFIKPVVHKCYKIKDHTKKFYVTDSCISCGKCQEECPSSAIKIIEGKPKWEKNCTFCLKCIHNCPVQAVQYGKTEGRKRYKFQEINFSYEK